MKATELTAAGNLSYKSPNLSAYYGDARQHWDELYPSERTVIERLGLNSNSSVLDMGCACGGLGNALKEKYAINNYVGVDINSDCITLGKTLFPWQKLYHGDFLLLEKRIIEPFDAAFSLSCADWNVATNSLLQALFSKVEIGGHLIYSCRLTNQSDVQGLIEAKQRIAFNDNRDMSVEYAPYKVYRMGAALQLLAGLHGAEQIFGFGYWGNRPETVIGLSFSDIFYIVFAVRRGVVNSGKKIRCELDVDSDILWSA